MATKTKVKPKIVPRERHPVPAAVNVLMGIQRVADAMDCSARQIRYMVRRGQFPKPDTSVGRNPRWSAWSFNDWVERTRVKTEVDEDGVGPQA